MFFLPNRTENKEEKKFWWKVTIIIILHRRRRFEKGAGEREKEKDFQYEICDPSGEIGKYSDNKSINQNQSETRKAQRRQTKTFPTLVFTPNNIVVRSIVNGKYVGKMKNENNCIMSTSQENEKSVVLAYVCRNTFNEIENFKWRVREEFYFEKCARAVRNGEDESSGGVDWDEPEWEQLGNLYCRNLRNFLTEVDDNVGEIPVKLVRFHGFDLMYSWESVLQWTRRRWHKSEQKVLRLRRVFPRKRGRMLILSLSGICSGTSS